MGKLDLGNWLDERLGLKLISRFLKEKKVPLHRHTPWYYTGSAILLFFTIQVITGFMLLFYYKPTLELANKSVAQIMNEVPLGWIIRSIHSWSASFMIACVFIHLIGIWLAKSYRKPREMTWLSGVILLLISLAFGFTGYLLPWDELSLSATKVGTDIPRSIPVVGIWVTKLLRGGEDVTQDTLTRFFGLHVSVLPIFAFLLIALHVYFIQKHGMSVPVEIEIKNEKPNELPFWPNFVYREMIVWLLLFGVLISVSILFPPSLGEEADLMAPAPEGIKPEWYFLFLFQTLKIFPAKILGVEGETVAIILILIAVLLFALLPFLDNKPAERKGKFVSLIAYLVILYALFMSIWSLM